ncbi:MAG: M1 family metallopeptidase [Bacteroidetes bacterium]|nr:M1 family metallopeptidase [Bacteroidota bacterium]
MKKFFLSCLVIAFSFVLFAQDNQKNETYNPHKLFTENFNPPRGNEFRSVKGVPGPKYWQNSAGYLIHATLDEKDTSIQGDVTITYTNNSPDDLDYIWLELEQNIFLPGSRSTATTAYSSDAVAEKDNTTGGYHLQNVTVIQGQNTYSITPVITDTRMQLRLQTPVKAKGDKIIIKMQYSFYMPQNGRRYGRQYTKNGVIYQVAQWYPRVCVYDDQVGWNTLPYLDLGEFYCEYGDYEYYITAPANMIVYGSGDLQNPAEVLSPKVINRLATAASSDKTVMIIGPDEINDPSFYHAGKGNLTWHFSMKNTRDVAWVAGKSMIWDAARVNLPSRHKAMAMSCYPIESAGDSAWGRSTEYLKASMEIYSKDLFEYPWHNAISSAGLVDGMEYPGIIFDNYIKKKSSLWFLIAHEIGHDWFPMIVGSNERRYMWLDEGLNTYVNYIATDLFNNGEYVNAPAYFEKGFFASRDYEQFMTYKDPLMTMSDAMDMKQHYQFYGKTAYGLNLLRTVVVGKERFDYAFRKYVEAWAFKHPTPYDFFNCINNAAGEDLNWFWKEWFFTTWKFDQAITNVTYVDNDPAKGSLITITNNGQMILPVIMRITQDDGNTETIKLPVEIWQRGGTWVYHYATKNKIQKVILDPDNQLPDTNRNNNEWGE